MARMISKIYGEALYEAVSKKGARVDAMEEAIVLTSVLSENPGFAQLMRHPAISRDEKLALLTDTFAGKLSGELLELLRVVIEKDRFRGLPQILAYFIDRVREAEGMGRAYVETAIELDDEEKERIRARLVETTPYRTMDVVWRVDPTLIGGMVIRIGDRVVDSSIRFRLESLKKQLSNVRPV